MGPCALHEVLFLCLSNLAVLPAVCIARSTGHGYCSVYFAMVGAVSLLYHACACGAFCLAFPFRTYVTLDYACSYGMIPAVCVLLMCPSGGRWRHALYQGSFLICLALVVTDRHGWLPRYALMGGCVGAMLCKVVLIDGPSFVRRQRSWACLCAGLCLAFAGVVMFYYDGRNGVPYWLGHSFWHVLAFVGVAMLVSGVPLLA